MEAAENPDLPVFTRKRQLICSQVETGSIDVCVCVCARVRTYVTVKPQPTHFSVGLLRWPSGKESSANAGDSCSMSRWGRCPGGGHGNPLQYSCLGIPWMEEPGGLQSMGSQKVRHD